jgi:hypothetical protein
LRLSRPFSFIRTLTVGFGIAPNLLTLFLPGDFRENKALAGSGLSTLTAGGEFHPALRTTAAQYERPSRKYGDARLRHQERSPGKSVFPHHQSDFAA